MNTPQEKYTVRIFHNNKWEELLITGPDTTTNAMNTQIKSIIDADQKNPVGNSPKWENPWTTEHVSGDKHFVFLARHIYRAATTYFVLQYNKKTGASRILTYGSDQVLHSAVSFATTLDCIKGDELVQQSLEMLNEIYKSEIKNPQIKNPQIKNILEQCQKLKTEKEKIFYWFLFGEMGQTK